MGKKGKRSRRRGEKGRVVLPPGTRPYTGYLPSNVTADDLDDDKVPLGLRLRLADGVISSQP